MGINRQDSRHRIKRTNLTGVVPTSHTASTDFTDGTWLNTDLREAELFYNIPDMRLWIGTGTSSIEIAQIGSTTSGNSLEQTLSVGNNSGTYDIIMGTSTAIKSLNGNSSIMLDTSGLSNNIFISTDGLGSEASIEMTPSSFSLYNSTGNITIGASIYNISLSSNVEISTGKSIKFDYTTITTGSISSSTIGTFSMATFSMANNSSISIKGHANGYCNSPNRNMGSTFYASFIKYGGSIYQNGTTDIVLKDGYGDGTTPAVWTDGTTIYISIRTFSALVSTFTTSYEKLI